MPVLHNATLRQVRYFVAVAEHGSFRRAADRLEVTQPTLTAQIQSLEKHLSLELVERSRTGTVLSPAGRELLPCARRLLEESRSFHDYAAALTGSGAGTYRLGVTPTLGPYLLPNILPQIHADFPDLKLYVREATPSDLEDQLKDARHDLILTTLPILSRELEVVRLFEEPYKLAISREHRLAGKARIDRSDLVGEEVLTIGEHHLLHHQIAELWSALTPGLRRNQPGHAATHGRHGHGHRVPALTVREV